MWNPREKHIVIYIQYKFLKNPFRNLLKKNMNEK